MPTVTLPASSSKGPRAAQRARGSTKSRVASRVSTTTVAWSVAITKRSCAAIFLRRLEAYCAPPDGRR